MFEIDNLKAVNLLLVKTHLEIIPVRFLNLFPGNN